MYRPYALMFLYIVWKKKKKMKRKRNKSEKEKQYGKEKKKIEKERKKRIKIIKRGQNAPKWSSIRSMHKCCEMKRKCMSMWKSEKMGS